uniref:Peptidoglycan-recognition protein SC2-like n=1 Tax=Diabrotica virgifera virgifera TaxID=50390 RepID=A0A6P7GXY5_DIAVI
HTATEEGFTQADNTLLVRLIQTFHIESRKWKDIAYNFVIGSDGLAYEGRGWGVIGSHTRNYNSKGISLKKGLDIAFEKNESNNDVSAVYIESPDTKILTNEDSADENDANFIDNRNGNQLSSGAEIGFLNDTRIEGTAEVTIVEENT